MADQKISQLTNYTPPLDADVLPIVDTANVETKKVTWANIKATLEAYFDTLYPTGSGTSTGTNTGDQTDATLPFTDITTNNFSTTKHGFTPKGTNVGNFLRDDGTWAAVSANDASTTVKGVVEAATSSEVTAGTGTGGTGAVLAVTPDALAASTPVFNGSGLTNVIASSNGTTTKDASDASGTQTIAHGLGKTPKTVEIRCTLGYTSVTISGSGREVDLFADTFYNGTTQSSQSLYAVSDNITRAATFTLNRANAAATTVGVITVDATNISIAWTKTGSATGVYNLLWRAIA